MRMFAVAHVDNDAMTFAILRPERDARSQTAG